MEITGRIIEILQPKEGKSKKGPWKKQDFIIETQDQYPKKICVTVWNDKFEVNNLENSLVKIHFDIESREFNERWYTDVKAWRLENMEQNSSKPENSNEDDNAFSIRNDYDDDDMPF